MPIYPFRCGDCGAYKEEIYAIADRPEFIPCHCGGRMKRQIGVSSADCFSECPKWIASVGDVANPNGGAAEREFVRNRTRENYNRFLKETGRRHVEAGETLGKTGQPVDVGKITREVYERQRERNKIHLS